MKGFKDFLRVCHWSGEAGFCTIVFLTVEYASRDSLNWPNFLGSLDDRNSVYALSTESPNMESSES